MVTLKLELGRKPKSGFFSHFLVGLISFLVSEELSEDCSDGAGTSAVRVVKS